MKLTFKRGQKKKNNIISRKSNETAEFVSKAVRIDSGVVSSYKEITSMNGRVAIRIFGLGGYENLSIDPLVDDENLETLNNLLSKRLLPVSSNKDNFIVECALYLSKHLKIGRIFSRFEETVVFPVSYSELSSEAFIKIRVYSIISPYFRMKIGTIRMDLFTHSGILKSGNYNVRLYHRRNRKFDRDERKLLDYPSRPGLEWLNEKTLSKMKKDKKHPLSALHPDRRKMRSGEDMHLKLQFPVFPVDVVHPDRYFESVERPESYPTIVPSAAAQPKKNNNNKPALKRKPSGVKKFQILDIRFDPDENFIEDSHLAMSNPIEEKFFKLFTQKSLYDPSFIKPNTNDLKKIQKILDLTPLDPIDLKDKYLLWKYRRYLMSNKRALVKFLKTVQWNDAKEYNEAKLMVEKWAEIDDIDALECLGYYFAQVPFVREYAVNRLKKLDDEQVRDILLQLVQSLRYEKETILKKGNGEVDSPLVNFLLERCCTNFVMSNFLEWYLRSEFEDPNYRDMYQKVHHMFRELMLERGRKDIFQKLEKQKVFVEEIRNIRANVKKKGRGRNDRISRLRKGLANSKWVEFFKKSPMDVMVTPGIQVNGFQPEIAHIFKSNLQPWLIPMLEPNGKSSRMIYKTGGDLRQGQLVVQIFRLMDNIMKRNALDLKLTPFEILSCSSSDGFVQCVHPCLSLYDIIYKEKKTIRSWLGEKNNQDREQYKRACDNFIRSSAGYCVITYLLGIGDRHLENILLQNNGKMFHIDFDFILGRDPKKYPPPMKIAPQMVDALKSMKTLSGENGYTKFIEYCCNSYNVLRRYSSLILNLFILMLDSNIPDLQNKGGQQSTNRMQKLNKIKEKFKLQLSDNEAIRAMRLIIEESEKALFSKINEAFHRAAQYWRE